MAHKLSRKERRALGQALMDVFTAARERPLPADRLDLAVRAVLALPGAETVSPVRAAMTGASMSNLADPEDFEHRAQAYDVARRAAYGIDDPKEATPS